MRTLLLTLVLVAIAPVANAINKCVDTNGKVEYRAEPCADSIDVTPKKIKDVADKPKQYVGERIKLNFSNMDIRTILQVIADYSGKKLRIAPGIEGDIAAKYDAPWDQVLEQIAIQHQLTVAIRADEIIVNKRR